VTREEILRAVFGGDLVARGRAYHEGPYAAFLLSVMLLVSFYVLFFRTGLRDRWTAAVAERLGDGVLGSVALVVLLRLSLGLVAFPLRAYTGWWNERAFGLGRLAFPAWAAEWAKSLAISTAVLAAGACALFFLVRYAGRHWWAAAWIALSLGAAALVLAAPRAVTPLFHRLAPLADPALRVEVDALARRAGIRASAILVADESRRSSHVNALVEGLGPTKRIVLYDTLLGFPRSEILLVVAHEIAHVARRHVAKGLGIGILAGGVVLFVASVLLRSGRVLRALGAEGAEDLRLVPALLLVYQIGTIAALPVENAIARRMESEADRISLELTGDASHFVGLERRLARENLSDVDPPGFFRALLYTHPSAIERVEEALRWAEARGVPVPLEDPAAPRGAPGIPPGAP
jgi:STE24 endopeptidase